MCRCGLAGYVVGPWYQMANAALPKSTGEEQYLAFPRTPAFRDETLTTWARSAFTSMACRSLTIVMIRLDGTAK